RLPGDNGSDMCRRRPSQQGLALGCSQDEDLLSRPGNRASTAEMAVQRSTTFVSMARKAMGLPSTRRHYRQPLMRAIRMAEEQYWFLPAPFKLAQSNSRATCR